MENRSILKVVMDNQCTGCGTCIAMCPKNALTLIINNKKGIYIPKLCEEKCNNCQICVKVCSGHEVNFKKLNHEIHGKQPDNILIGNYLNCYTGYSTDYDIRYNSSSGGLITKILIFALEEGIINGALVTRMKKDNPLEPEPFIARTKEEIIEASGSKYCPVPVNIALNEILESSDEEKFAIVGLPCHIHGVKKAEQVNNKLKEKIVMTLGIICNHTPNFWGTKLILRKLHIKEEELSRLCYRGNGWPGYMEIKTNDDITKLELLDYWNFVGSHFFYSKRCLMCIDGMCEFADLSFGDAWLPEFSENSVGTSIILSRTDKGENILKTMNKYNLIKLNRTYLEKIIQSQIGMIYIKKNNLKAFKLFKDVPDYQIECQQFKFDFMDYLFTLILYLNSFISLNSYSRNILSHIPLKIIKLYNIPYNMLLIKKARKDFKEFLL